MRFLSVVLLCICIGLGYLVPAQAYGSFQLANDKTIVVEDSFLVFEDSSKNIGIDEITSPAYQRKFHKIDPENFSVDEDVYWVKFQIRNPAAIEDQWIFDFDQWVDVQFYYKLPSEGGFLKKQTGHLVPFQKRDHPVANKNYIKLGIPGGAVFDCVVRLETHYNYILRPTTIRFEVSPERVLLEKEIKKQRLIFMFLGIYLVMFLYNFFVYVSTKEESYRYYLILLLIMIFILLHNFGYTVSIFHFFDQYAHWHGHVELIVSALLGIMLFFFASSILDLKNRLPRAHRFLNVLAVIVFLMPIPSFFGYTLANQIYSSLLGIFSMLSVIVIGIISYRRGTPSAGYFLLAYGFFLLCLIVYLIGFESGLLRSDYSPFLVQIGSAGEIILFSFALANRINILQKDNEDKQERLIQQLRQNQELQTKVNRELEQKVKERTREIEAQKEELAREKDKSDNLLLNILPDSTAEELKEKGFASTRQYDQVTVLFTDFKDFTSLANKLSPYELVEGLDYCFKAFDDIAERNGLEKIKTIGDSFMCAGGIPDPNGSNPSDAINAALEMQVFIEQWKQNRIAEGKVPWELRIGINTGSVVAGVVGKKKFAYDIWGDTVNIASRMEAEGEVGKINISQSTYELVAGKFHFQNRGKIAVKGKGEMNMYFVTGKRSNE